MTTIKAHGTQAISQIRSLDGLHGHAGRLEALLNTGSANAPYSALVCHPHPSGGGTMHNKVVYHAMKAFAAFGLPVLRFNFRGVGLSEGEHDHGHGELEDVRAALNWLDEKFHRPILFAGFSFGAQVGLRACQSTLPGATIPTDSCRNAPRQSSSSAATTTSLAHASS